MTFIVIFIFQNKLVFQKQPSRVILQNKHTQNHRVFRRGYLKFLQNSQKTIIIIMKKNHQRGRSFQVYCPRLKLKDKAFYKHSPRINQNFRVPFYETLPVGYFRYVGTVRKK